MVSKFKDSWLVQNSDIHVLFKTYLFRHLNSMFWKSQFCWWSENCRECERQINFVSQFVLHLPPKQGIQKYGVTCFRLVYCNQNATILTFDVSVGRLTRKEELVCTITLHDWLKKLAPLFHPIGTKAKTNRDLIAFSQRFPALTQATFIYFVFWLVGRIALASCDWLEWPLGLCFSDTQLRTGPAETQCILWETASLIKRRKH